MAQPGRMPYHPPAHLISNSGLTTSQICSQFEDFKGSLPFVTAAPELVFERVVSNLLAAAPPKAGCECPQLPSHQPCQLSHPQKMSTKSDALPRTSIASVCWGENNIRTYWQDTHGWIRESAFGGKWTGGTSQDIITKAKLTTPLAAVQCIGGSQIHIYFLDSRNIIQEYYWDNDDWFQGTLGGSCIVADPRTKLAAVLSDGPYIRLYYQKPDDQAINQLCWCPSTKWIGGATLPHACLGSSLAAINWNGQIRVYYQSTDYRFREHCWNGSWTAGNCDFDAPFSSSITAIIWGHERLIRLYWVNKSGNMTVALSDKGGQWHTDKRFSGVISGSSVSSVFWDIFRVRVFHQGADYAIEEWDFNDRWRKGETVPTH